MSYRVPMSYQAQSGEDKFLEPLLPEKGWFVDVGAVNGVWFSNTYFLVEKGWDGVEIEGNPVYYSRMLRVIPERIHKVHKYIKEDELDATLANYPVPKDFDLLSIDIDSYDYHLWKNLKIYTPKFVIIEVGSATTPEAMNALAEEKGYKLIWDKANFIYEKI